MKITILTLFPKMIDGFLNESILKRAQEKELVQIEIVNIRDFADDAYGTVDGKPYGGGVGMVMRVDVLHKALTHVKTKNKKLKVILTSAKGKKYNQTKAKEYAILDHIIIIAGHYEGVDERILDYVDEEISVGDYILTGGELPACIIADSIVRLIPDVLKHKEATEKESFSQSLHELSTNNQELTTLLEYPQYTRPEEFMGKKVPEILLSGDHEKIKKWQKEKAIEETKNKRPDLLDT